VGALAVAALDHRDVLIGLVGEGRVSGSACRLGGR